MVCRLVIAARSTTVTILSFYCLCDASLNTHIIAASLSPFYHHDNSGPRFRPASNSAERASSVSPSGAQLKCTYHTAVEQNSFSHYSACSLIHASTSFHTEPISILCYVNYHFLMIPNAK